MPRDPGSVDPNPEPPRKESRTPAVVAEDDRPVAWGRWFAGFWAVLALLALIERNWGLLGMALTFIAGFSNQELRARQGRVAGMGAPVLFALPVATAALGAVGIYLLLRYEFRWAMPWWGAPPLFAALLIVNLAGRSVLRVLRRSPPDSPDA